MQPVRQAGRRACVSAKWRTSAQHQHPPLVVISSSRSHRSTILSAALVTFTSRRNSHHTLEHLASFGCSLVEGVLRKRALMLSLGALLSDIDVRFYAVFLLDFVDAIRAMRELGNAE